MSLFSAPTFPQDSVFYYRSDLLPNQCKIGRDSHNGVHALKMFNSLIVKLKL